MKITRREKFSWHFTGSSGVDFWNGMNRWNPTSVGALSTNVENTSQICLCFKISEIVVRPYTIFLNKIRGPDQLVLKKPTNVEGQGIMKKRDFFKEREREREILWLPTTQYLCRQSIKNWLDPKYIHQIG